MDTFPRSVRPAPDPLGLYFRAGSRDHTTLLQVLAERTPRISGVVFDPCAENPMRELPLELTRRSMETILDSRGMEMAFSGPDLSRLAKLPWGAAEPDKPEVLRAPGGRAGQLVRGLADFVRHRPFSAILTPTHFLAGPDDPWFEVDRRLVWRLREQLDAGGRSGVLIYYLLGIPRSVFCNSTAFARIVELLATVPLDGVWLRIHPFGTKNAGPLSLRSYIESARYLDELNAPVVAERTGTVGVALLAFGAAGAIESGITVGESFDVRRWSRVRPGAKPFLPPPRVYISELGIFLPPQLAKVFFENRHMKSSFACRNTDCCRRGAADMLADPRHHFVLTRVREVSWLSGLPSFIRPAQYLEEHLRPASDLAVKAAKVDPRLERDRDRIDAWRMTLGAMAREGVPERSARVPTGRRLQRRLGA